MVITLSALASLLRRGFLTYFKPIRHYLGLEPPCATLANTGFCAAHCPPPKLSRFNSQCTVMMGFWQRMWMKAPPLFHKVLPAINC